VAGGARRGAVLVALGSLRGGAGLICRGVDSGDQG
jgi:hypothetical protein